MKKCFFINEKVLLTYYMVLHWPTYFAPFQKYQVEVTKQ